MNDEQKLMQQQQAARALVEKHFENIDQSRTYKCVGMTEEFDFATVQATGEGGTEVLQYAVTWTDASRRLLSSVTLRK